MNYNNTFQYVGFNSYMVRFKGRFLQFGYDFTEVSIPIWFDLKRVEKQNEHHFESFNSYMVRFKEDGKEVKPDAVKLFQFLYGSI